MVDNLAGTTKMKYAVVVSIAILGMAVLTLGGGLYFKFKSDIADREAVEERQSQFCSLLLNIHQDRARHLMHTREYLATSAGREATSLNIYIKRVSLPQTESELREERQSIPKHCLEE
jgi:hypothetical protein